MERNQWADRFTDNVVRRTERDSGTSVYVVFLLLCIPMLLAITFSFIVVETNQDIFGSMDVIEIAFSTILVGEPDSCSTRTPARTTTTRQGTSNGWTPS